jgi:hypothetical protein
LKVEMFWESKSLLFEFVNDFSDTCENAQKTPKYLNCEVISDKTF